MRAKIYSMGFVDVMLNDGPAVMCVLAGERDVELLRREGGSQIA